jgi:hypothetical protein
MAGNRQAGPEGCAFGVRYAGIPRLGWLILGSFLFYGLLLWLLGGLPFSAGPSFALPEGPRPLLVENLPAPAAAPSPSAPPAAVPAAGSTAAPASSSASAAPVPRTLPLSAAVPAAASASGAASSVAPPPPAQAPPVPPAGPSSVSVFTVTVPTSRLVYLVDVSGSMFDLLDPQGRESRFQAATDEVRRSIRLLPPDVSFNVVLFADHPVAMAPEPVPATPEGKARAEAFLGRIPDLGGGTDFVAGLRAALGMGPDSIFLLTDGGANEPDWQLLRDVGKLEQAAPAPSRLYAFGMVPRLDDEGDRTLLKLCRQSGGTYQSMATWRKEN